jgi:hypothetical protein
LAFVRRKKMHGKHYYQLVHNYRVGGRHRQKVLCHLGVHESIEGAIEGAKQQVTFHEELATSKGKDAERIRAKIKVVYGEEVTIYDKDYAEEELKRLRWTNPYASFWYRVQVGEEEWNLGRERWEAEKKLVDWCLDYHRARQESEVNKLRADRLRAKLNKLLALQ